MGTVLFERLFLATSLTVWKAWRLCNLLLESSPELDHLLEELALHLYRQRCIGNTSRQKIIISFIIPAKLRTAFAVRIDLKSG